jgi:hypothetical protein
MILESERRWYLIAPALCATLSSSLAALRRAVRDGGRSASAAPRPVFFHLLRGRADGAVEGAVADVVVTLSTAAPTTDPPPLAA